MDKEGNLIKKLGFARVKIDEPMKDHTYMKVGGPADFFYEAQSAEELETAIKEAISENLPYTVIGQGANVLVADKGIRGLVILNRSSAIKYLAHDFLEVDSGVNVLELNRELSKRSLGGLERMTKVPASVGGAVFMNAGDTGRQEFFGDLVEAVTVIDTAGNVKKLHKEDLGFAYRTSRLQESGEIILTVKMQVKKMTKEETEEKMRDILVRKAKHPAGPSVGSTFRNPPGEHAGALIEKAGLKGMTVGNAKISEQHANFIINTGGARAVDIKALIDTMKLQVKEKFGIDLHEEVRYLGEW